MPPQMSSPSDNIHPVFERMLQRQDKEVLLNQRGLAVWMTGLSGSGKTTIAIALEQLLHELIRRIEKICVGFDDHKQSVFNLVQSLKTLFLYSQSEKETVENYTRNFRSLWDTVEAFGGCQEYKTG